MVLFDRNLQIAEFVADLKKDHQEVRRQEWILGMLVARGDYEFATQRAVDLQSFLGQHFLKEEGVLGDVLVNTGAATSTITPRAKRKMFKDSLIGKHRAIADSFQEIRKIGTAFSEKERLLAFDHFERTLLRLLMEEERLAFLP